MTKTMCNKCVFADTASSIKPCQFDIIEKIKDIKKLNIVDDYYEIDNYTCLYGFSQNQYRLNSENMKDIDLFEEVKNKSAIKYYAVVDMRKASIDDIIRYVGDLKLCKIKPKRLSIIINSDKADRLHEILKENPVTYKWTMHLFVKELPFNDCINIVLDTNLLESGAWCLLFVDLAELYGDKNKPSILDIIDNMQTTFIIEQRNFHGMKLDDNSLNLLCLNCSVYKAIVSNISISRNILDGIKTTPEINIVKYEI